MANINITNLEAGKGAGENLKSSVINTLDSLRNDTSTFSSLALIDPSMEGKLSTEYNGSIQDIYNFLNNHIYPSIMEYFKEDNNSRPRTSGRSNGGGGSISNTEDNYETPEEVHEAVPAVVDIPDIPEFEFNPEIKEEPVLTDLSKIDKSALDKMTLREFEGMLNELIELAKLKNVTLDELLLKEEYSTLIKETLVSSPYISQDFKKTLLELDANDIRRLYLNMVNGEYLELYDVNALNLNITRSYLEKIAEENGITVDELLNNKEYQKLLKESLEKSDNAIDLIKGWEDLSAEEFQDQLKSFYLGDVPEEFPNEDIYASRSFVDTLAGECDVGYEEFLNDVSYADTLKDGAVEFGKSLKFFETLTHTKNDMLFGKTNELLIKDNKPLNMNGSSNLNNGVNSSVNVL